MIENDRMYPITSVCKGDIIQMFEDSDKLTPEIQKKIESLDDGEMSWLASKLADGFCNCCFWLHLKDRVEQLLEEKKCID